MTIPARCWLRHDTLMLLRIMNPLVHPSRITCNHRPCQDAECQYVAGRYMRCGAVRCGAYRWVAVQKQMVDGREQVEAHDGVIDGQLGDAVEDGGAALLPPGLLYQRLQGRSVRQRRRGLDGLSQHPADVRTRGRRGHADVLLLLRLSRGESLRLHLLLFVELLELLLLLQLGIVQLLQ